MGHWDPSLPITSSEEPAWTREAEECYRDAIRTLLRADVPFVVGGAFAVHRHTGVWRPTKDLDIFLVPARIPDAFACLQAEGFVTSVEDPVWLAKARRGHAFVDLITGVGNASLVVTEDWISRGQREIVLGVPCTVLPPEECVASKTFVAFRERFDGADVVHLIKACGPQMDWDRVLQLMDGHWELLYWSLVLYAYVYPARADQVPASVWEELTRRFAERVRHPDRNAPFRGSLVDPRMFAIDVEEWGERNLYQEFCSSHPCRMAKEPMTENEE
ncbi:nucleotidyltransferase family protein [Acidobacteria bacterium AB60]|nr:nucleotidyltransferase family protein [Acidobacteria bacterium AB60]